MTLNSFEGTKKPTFSNIYIFLGTKPNVENVLVNSTPIEATKQNQAPAAIYESSLFINPKSVPISNSATQVKNEADLLSKLGNHIWVVFQRKATAPEGQNQSNAPLYYAFYMGQEQNNKTFPIVIPSQLISTQEFFNQFVGSAK